MRLSRTAAGAVTSSLSNWLNAAVRDFTALPRTTCNWRMDSTTPVVSFGTAVHSPASTLRAAASASMRSVLSRCARVCEWGRLTSTTAIPHACR